MSIFDVLTMIGGLCLFLFGMDLMGQALERRAGGRLRTMLDKMTGRVMTGFLTGMAITAVIQSSSATTVMVVGFVNSGLMTLRQAINVIGVVVLLTVFCIVRAVFAPAILHAPATMYGIAVAHSCFNVICTALLLPCGGLLEKLAVRLVPDGPQEKAEQPVELDERLLATPPLALQQCRAVAEEMAACAAEALNRGLDAFSAYTPELAEGIRRDEKRCDRYEDALGTYLVRLSTQQMGAAESEEATELLKTIGDFERISDHAVNVLESAEELRTKGLTFSKTAQRELDVLSKAVRDILALAVRAFREQDMDAAGQVEPLEQVIDDLKEQMRTRHILRLQQGQCSIETGFVWCDLLTDLERTSDHCSNIAGCVIDAAQHDLNLHETLRSVRHSDGTYRRRLDTCAEVYRLPPPEQA